LGQRACEHTQLGAPRRGRGMRCFVMPTGCHCHLHSLTHSVCWTTGGRVSLSRRLVLALCAADGKRRYALVGAVRTVMEAVDGYFQVRGCRYRVVPYRRLRIQARGGLGYRFAVQACHYC
jgi:hypothetical protein